MLNFFFFKKNNDKGKKESARDDMEKFIDMVTGHKWYLYSNKRITQEQHDEWMLRVLEEWKETRGMK